MKSIKIIDKQQNYLKITQPEPHKLTYEVYTSYNKIIFNDSISLLDIFDSGQEPKDIILSFIGAIINNYAVQEKIPQIIDTLLFDKTILIAVDYMNRRAHNWGSKVRRNISPNLPNVRELTYLNDLEDYIVTL